MSRDIILQQRIRALGRVADRGARVAEALARRLGDCRTTAETVRLAEAFSQVSEEVCSAVALEMELRRQHAERAAAAEPELPTGPAHGRMH